MGFFLTLGFELEKINCSRKEVRIHHLPRKVMQFNYNTLQVRLHSKTRSVEVLLNRPEKEHQINIEMLFELESLFSWLTSHLEVNAITLSSTPSSQNLFSKGFDRDELIIMSEDKVKKYMVRFQKVITGMIHLPQTIICDLKEGAEGMGVELALGADIRLSSQSSTLHFNSLEKGWVSCCGNLSTLSDLVGQSLARQWTLAGKEVSAKEMIRSGLVMDTYKKGDHSCESLLTKISLQAPVARIQTKGALTDHIRTSLEQGQLTDSSYSFSALSLEDFKKDQSQFTQARDFGMSVKSRVAESPDLQA